MYLCFCLSAKCISEVKIAILMKGEMIICYHKIFLIWGHYNDIQGYHNTSHTSEIHLVMRRTELTWLNSYADQRPKFLVIPVSVTRE